MRKGIIVLATLLLLAGCSKKETITTSNDNEEAVITEAVKESTDEDVKEEGFQFETSGVTISMNTDAAPIVEALGEPVEYFEAASCAFQGLDKIYTYNGFEINTYPNENKDYIASVYFLDDSVTTEKGIYLGAALDEVIEAYGDDYIEEAGEYTYTLGETILSFIVEDGSVTSITYTAIVEGLNH